MNWSASPPRLQGSPAFRDLGGAPTDDGRHVASGRLFRADALAVLDDTDRAVIDRLGLRLICDLRGRLERERTPCLAWLDPAPASLHLDVSSGLTATVAPSVVRLMRGPDPGAASTMMRMTYAGLPRSAAPFLRELFPRLVGPELPVLVHCTAGKDRTGFVIAMILSALGVTREFIVEDYLRGSGRDPLINHHPNAHVIEAIVGRRLEPEEARVVHGVYREYLEAAFATIEDNWGGTLEYLEGAAGVDAARRQALREALLT